MRLFYRIIIIIFMATIIVNCKSTPKAIKYNSFDIPLIRKTNKPSAGVKRFDRRNAILYTGEYYLALQGDRLLLTRRNKSGAMILRPLGEDLNLFSYARSLDIIEEKQRYRMVIHGSAPWTDFLLQLWLYKYNPGLIHYRIELIPSAPVPAGDVKPEWSFIDTASGLQTSAEYTSYADRAPAAAPCFYGYTGKLKSTILYWVDLTRLNKFSETVHYSSAGTPGRRNRFFGHNVGWSDIYRLPIGSRSVIYDSYLYIAPDEPSSEAGLFKRYLLQVSDIYDLLAKPRGMLPDWQKIAAKTLDALRYDSDTVVYLNGKRYWRAYVSDTRKSVEAITQLDVGLSAARYIKRYGGTEVTTSIVKTSSAALEDFYNPDFALIQNNGPLSLTGNQGRGDTWYELGSALKAAEWGLLGYKDAADLAKKSRASWIDFAKTVNYKFPQFYKFKKWNGTGREPDAAGGYALYMIRLAGLYKEKQAKDLCIKEAMKAVHSFSGYGFNFSYETHMTAAAALAAAYLAEYTGNNRWFDYAYGPIANLVRLSWLYEANYGKAKSAMTFFGLSPTQTAAAITPKEQYEAWIYISEFLKIAHGKVDPSVEKLTAEFYYYTILTLKDSLPPFLPAGIITEYPSAYETVKRNRLDLYIPIEDMRNGWDVWGAIGQEVYGAGMAPTFAALAYNEVFPGVTIYSGYPIVDIQGAMVTFSGIPGMFIPALVIGCSKVFYKDGTAVDTQRFGKTLRFMAEGGKTYILKE